MSLRLRLLFAVIVGVVAGIACASADGARIGALSGLDALNFCFLVGAWLTIWPMGPEETELHAKQQDPALALRDLMLTGAALASLAAVAFVLAGAAKVGGTEQVVRLVLGVGSVALSWGTVHTLFTLRYARIYYKGTVGGVEFNQRLRPSYAEFAYLAFTVGMTFQVSDTAIKTGEMRRAVLRHALLAYLFGVGIIATTINLIATVTSS
ncbi:MAG TPA: DUF1345 domain-containing protein [Solirubrobacteraceae bacterium]|nr:DUF1345 domain-containing protein [Solirubrobacteraceae bacterium]